MGRRQEISALILKDKSLTDFEKRVYTVVLGIPPGEVRTYKWVARKISRPTAARAVGNALNKNPYAPEVPCHRVIKSDGSIGGFSRGPSAKKRMLKAEGVDSPLSGCYNHSRNRRYVE